MDMCSFPKAVLLYAVAAETSTRSEQDKDELSWMCFLASLPSSARDFVVDLQRAFICLKGVVSSSLVGISFLFCQALSEIAARCCAASWSHHVILLFGYLSKSLSQSLLMFRQFKIEEGHAFPWFSMARVDIEGSLNAAICTILKITAAFSMHAEAC